MARLPVSVWLRVLRGLRRSLRRSLRVLWPGALLLGWILLAIWVLGPVNIYFTLFAIGGKPLNSYALKDLLRDSQIKFLACNMA